jgi:pyruvate/2-oxoacid:ferredoxin oxidoreductase beta subunit
MQDMVAKIEKGLAASKKGFAYLHIISPCPTGWSFEPNQSIQIARKAVACNIFPLWEMENGKYKITVENKKPVPVKDFTSSIGKYKKLTKDDIQQLQKETDRRYDLIKKLSMQ